jgi:glycosyltransferase involved in cell wall biosynthesis
VTDVGGIGSLVVPGRNGHILPLDAGAAAWAQAAAALLRDPEGHAQMCRASFAHAHQRLSWSAWAQDTLAFATSPRVLAA